MDPLFLATALITAIQAYATDAWAPIINYLRYILVACGGLGFIIGAAIGASAGDDVDRKTLSHRIMASTIVGLLVGLMAEDLYNIIFGWTGV